MQEENDDQDMECYREAVRNLDKYLHSLNVSTVKSHIHQR